MANLRFSDPTSVFNDVSALVSAGQVPIVPSYGTNFQITSREKRTQFGDGYGQRAPDGINTEVISFTAVFERRSLLVATNLIKFFRGVTPFDRQPHEYFYFLVPEPINTEMKFVVSEGKWGFVPDQANSFTVSVPLTRVFDA